MGTYKEIRGTHIVSVTSDPPSPVNGQMWYNSTERVVKGFTSSPVGSWATGGAMNTARRYPGGAGTQTAALAFGGLIDPPATNYTQTEQYNGTSWTEVSDLNTARWQGGNAGVSYDSVLMSGGYVSTPGSRQAIVESWNGSSWTEVADLNTARYGAMSSGTNTSATVAGGNSPGGDQAINESWNGSAWTEVGDLNTARTNGPGGGSGTSNTSALVFGGRTPATPDETAVTESWNGSSWTELNDLNSARFDMGSSKGSVTSALAFGGYDSGFRAFTESWNGTSWTETTDLSAAKADVGGSGASNTSALAFGGRTPPNNPSTTTEEFTSPTTSTVTFTVS